MKTESVAGKTFILWDNETKKIYVCDTSEKGEVAFPDTKSFFGGTKAQVKSKITALGLVSNTEFDAFLNS